jgi:plastocyanin
MMYLHTQYSLKITVHRVLQFSILLASLLSTNMLHAEPAYTKEIEVTLGDYHYMPKNIQLVIDQPVVLHLVNVDSFTPHNFTLKDASNGLDVDVDIPAGETVDVNLMPLVTGSYIFYCSNKLLWMDSHREKGMEGTLTVVPDLQPKLQPGQQAERQAEPQAD